MSDWEKSGVKMTGAEAPWSWQWGVLSRLKPRPTKLGALVLRSSSAMWWWEPRSNELQRRNGAQAGVPVPLKSAPCGAGSQRPGGLRSSNGAQARRENGEIDMTIWKVWQRKNREEPPQGTRSDQGWLERRKITHRGKTLRAFRAYLE